MVKGEAMPNSARPVADGGNLDATRLRALRSRQLWDQLPDRSALMFDRDLRLLLSEGTTLRRSGRVDAEAAADAGVTADAEIGAPLTDVLSAHAMAFVEAHCRAATSGVAADLKYPHPQMGRKIRLRTGPLTGPDGTIVGGFVVTDGVSEWAQGSTIQADLEHTRLLRGIGDALAGPRLAGADLLQNVAERASVALDSVAFLRLLSPNLDAIERDLVAHPVEQIRRNVEVAMRRSSQSFEPGTPVHDQVIRRGTLLSTIGPQEVPPESLRLVHGQIEWNAEHFVVAPVRHDGQVLGVFGVFRTDIEAPYAPGDDDLVQVLADSIGSAIAESRAGAATEKEQCELLEHLATTESRERSMLAEALHDDPLQLVVAAILRIDNLRLRTDSGQEEQLEQVADMLETAVERMRKLIVAVTPPDFELGLGRYPALFSRKRTERWPSSIKTFSRADGTPLGEGDMLVQRDLAATLAAIAEQGPRGFYEGPVAEKLVKAVTDAGGIMTLEDLKSYQPTIRPPVRGTYRGYDIVSMPLPSSGGTVLLETLNILEGFPIADLQQGSAASLHLIIEAMKHTTPTAPAIPAIPPLSTHRPTSCSRRTMPPGSAQASIPSAPRQRRSSRRSQQREGSTQRTTRWSTPAAMPSATPIR